MKLRHYFLLLVIGILLVAAVALYATFSSHPWLFYATECFVVILFLYLGHFYQKTLRPFDTIVSGMELLREVDLSTTLAPSGQHETDVIVNTFNQLLRTLRSEHLQLTEQNTFLSQLIEASPMGIVQCDLSGNFTTLNPAAREMMTPTVRQALLDLPLGSETTLRLTGAPLIYRLSHLSFPDRGYHHPFYLIESLTSEVRLAEKAAYERVIRMIAHEVNNSVTGISGVLNGLMADGRRATSNENPTVDNEADTTHLPQPSTVPCPLSIVHSLKDRLLALSDFVTRFASVVKIPEPHLLLCDLSEEVEACRPFLESLCHSTGIRLHFRLTDEAIPVHLDTALFQQVLINIVKNSIEAIGGSTHTVPEGASIRLEVASPGGVSPSGGTLIITDNGRGIPPEVSQHLFTPFYSTKPAGQGLGLLLVRDILTAHGCTFTLLTDPTDHLTRFTIHFP